MPFLIGPTQVSFVAGQSITENIIIAQEVVHSMRVKKGKDRWMAIKVDLEKAYDWIRWEFVEDTLNDVSFSHNFIRVIIHCISSCTMQLLQNGCLTNEF